MALYEIEPVACPVPNSAVELVCEGVNAVLFELGDISAVQKTAQSLIERYRSGTTYTTNFGTATAVAETMKTQPNPIRAIAEMMSQRRNHILSQPETTRIIYHAVMGGATVLLLRQAENYLPNTLFSFVKNFTGVSRGDDKTRMGEWEKDKQKY